MIKPKITIQTIDDYIRQFSPEVQKILQDLRQVVREAAPEASERISYQMPALYLNGILVYYAAFKNHIGFFPTASGIDAFKTELSAYPGSKGTVRFPYNQPLPMDLITRIVQYRAKENKIKRP